MDGRSISNGAGQSGGNGDTPPFYLKHNWELAGLVWPFRFSFWTEQA